jgi:hypothetical protein
MGFILTKQYPAPKGKLNPSDFKNWLKNLLRFLYPLAALYFTQVIGTLAQPDHAIALKDLYPSYITIGGGVLYIYNAIFDIYRKFVDGPTK